jgi:hypothetical protein
MTYEPVTMDGSAWVLRFGASTSAGDSATVLLVGRMDADGNGQQSQRSLPFAQGEPLPESLLAVQQGS